VLAGAARPAAERWQTLGPVQPASKGRARTCRGMNSGRGTIGAACRCRRTPGERRLGAANAGMGKPRRRRTAELNARCKRRRLTFELRGRSRRGAWPAKRMMTASASRAKCHAGGGPWLERRVRPHPPYVACGRCVLPQCRVTDARRRHVRTRDRESRQLVPPLRGTRGCLARGTCMQRHRPP
jgi:hypothetical protein